MTKLCLLIGSLITSSVCFAQEPLAPQQFRINVNDTNGIRIVDGVVSKEKYVDDKFEIHQLGGQEQKKLGLHSPRTVTVINTLNTPIEGYIFTQVHDSFLASDLPYYAKMAIAVNGQLLSTEERKQIYPRMQESHVKRTTFVNRLAAQKRYPNAPFGVVEVAYDAPWETNMR